MTEPDAEDTNGCLQNGIVHLKDEHVSIRNKSYVPKNPYRFAVDAVDNLIDEKDAAMEHVEQFRESGRYFVIGQFIRLTNDSNGVFNDQITRGQMLLTGQDLVDERTIRFQRSYQRQRRSLPRLSEGFRPSCVLPRHRVERAT